MRVASDSDFRMDVSALREAVTRDLAEKVKPLAVIATVGTTSTASVDPIPEIAKICRENNIWLHIDGAYGGGFALLPEFRGLTEGWADADSIVINPHKTVFVPLDFSVLYVRDIERFESVYPGAGIFARRYHRGGEKLHGLRHPAWPQVPGTENVGDLAIVRARRNGRIHARAFAVGAFVRGLGERIERF